jgi:hypothetical protein
MLIAVYYNALAEAEGLSIELDRCGSYRFHS